MQTVCWIAQKGERNKMKMFIVHYDTVAQGFGVEPPSQVEAGASQVRRE